MPEWEEYTTPQGVEWTKWCSTCQNFTGLVCNNPTSSRCGKFSPYETCERWVLREDFVELR